MKSAIVGAGRMGRRHIAAVRDMGSELAGICDTNPEALTAAAAEHGLVPGQLFHDPAEMLRSARPELVIVATTAPSHAELTCLAAEMGALFILCEKPMAPSLAECDRMIETTARCGVRLAVNHQMRFMPEYREIKRMVQSEALGGLRGVTVIGPNMGLAMNGTHIFELFRYLTDEPPAQVTAWFSDDKVPNPRGPQFEDRAGAVRVTTTSGRRLYLEAAADQGCGVTLIVASTFGQIVMDDLEGTATLVVREPEHRALPTTRYTAPSRKSTLQMERKDIIGSTRALLQELVSGGDYPSGEQARTAVEVLVAAYVSHENGHCPVCLEGSVLPRDRRFPWA